MDRMTMTFAVERLERVEIGDRLYTEDAPRSRWREMLGLRGARTLIVTGIVGGQITVTHPIVWRMRQLRAWLSTRFNVWRALRAKRPSQEEKET